MSTVADKKNAKPGVADASRVPFKVRAFDLLVAGKRAEAEERKAQSHAKKTHETKVADLENRVLLLQTRLAEITTELEKPETYQANGAAMTLSRESVAVSASLDQLIAEGLLLASQETKS